MPWVPGHLTAMTGPVLAAAKRAMGGCIPPSKQHLLDFPRLRPAANRRGTHRPGAQTPCHEISRLRGIFGFPPAKALEYQCVKGRGGPRFLGEQVVAEQVSQQEHAYVIRPELGIPELHL